MATSAKPTISAVVAAYQAERWIGETLESILGQTRPPDEVIVVDDGSTDGTARELERYADRVQIIDQPNRGCPAAFNTAFAAARGDFVAMCGADDVWKPEKLEWQAEAIETHPEAEVYCGHAILFGRIEAEHPRPPEFGLLDSPTLREALFPSCILCAPTVVIRRSLFERLGPFVENFGADDYEYWFRCLRAGARFYYDPRPLVSWRQHGDNLSWQGAWMDECTTQVRRWYEADVPNRTVVRKAMAPVLFRVARNQVDDDRPAEARSTFREALRYGRGVTLFDNARVIAWIAILSLPGALRRWAGRVGVGMSRTIGDLGRTRQSSSP